MAAFAQGGVLLVNTQGPDGISGSDGASEEGGDFGVANSEVDFRIGRAGETISGS